MLWAQILLLLIAVVSAIMAGLLLVGPLTQARLGAFFLSGAIAVAGFLAFFAGAFHRIIPWP